MTYNAIFIVCEFDPLHFGHEYLICQARQLGSGAPVVCILSGNFTQRGECAVIDKYDRAKAAVLCGADLVVSLPVVYSCACAEVFARGAVQIANSLYPNGKCGLLFGSESGDIDALCLCADRLSSVEFKSAMASDDKSEGIARRRGEIYKNLYGDDGVLSTPNNILGIEYIRAINAFAPNITPMTIKRCGASHNSADISHPFVSASYLRENITCPSFFGHIPTITHEIYKNASDNGAFPAEIKNGERTVLQILRSSQKQNYADCIGGLYEAVLKSAKKASCYADVFNGVSTKKYTLARIRRAVTAICLGITEDDISAAPSFTQLLACNEKGAELLSKTKKQRESFVVVTKPSSCAAEAFKKELNADNLYAFMMPKTAPFNYSLKKTPFIAKCTGICKE